MPHIKIKQSTTIANLIFLYLIFIFNMNTSPNSKLLAFALQLN